MTSLSGLGVTAPVANLTQLRDDWQHLSELIERRQDLHFIIKPHPRYDYYDFYRNLCANLPSNVELREGVSLSEVFPDVSVAVMVNYPSTAALEAMLAGVPLVYLRSAMYKAAGLRSALDAGNVICVDHVEDLETVLDELIGNPARRAEALENSQAFVAQFAPYVGETALARMLDVIDQLTSQEKQQQARPIPNRATDILLFMRAIREYLASGNKEYLHEALAPVAKRDALLEVDRERLWEVSVVRLLAVHIPSGMNNVCAPDSMVADLLSAVPQELRPPHRVVNRLYARMYVAVARKAYRAGELTYAVKFALQVTLRSPGLAMSTATQAFARRLGAVMGTRR